MSRSFALLGPLLAVSASAQIPEYSPAQVVPPPRVSFVDATASARLSGFEHRSYLHGGDGVGGAAWFDSNNDGLLDLYLTNGKIIGDPGAEGRPNALFLNGGDGTFMDVAQARGAACGQGNSGVIAVDFDNDGDQDLFLTGDGGLLGHAGLGAFPTIDSGCKLLENTGPPTYEYVTIDLATAGLGSIGTSTSAAAADVNFDGLLDLFVCSSGTLAHGCPGPPGCCQGGFGSPTLERSRLFINSGGGSQLSFEEVSRVAAAQSEYGALAAAFHDVDLDGRPELFVCNGTTNLCLPTPIELFRHAGLNAAGEPVLQNQGASQPALSQNGAWMGIAIGMFGSDLDPANPRNEHAELFVTNAGGLLPHALMKPQLPSLVYQEAASSYGIGQGSPPSEYFGWGCTAKDFDADGRPDLFLTGSYLPYGFVGPVRANPGTLLLNDEAGGLVDFSATIPDHSERYTSGVAAGDYDGDGRIDLVIVTDAIDSAGDNGTPILLRNTTPDPAPWIKLRVYGNGVDTNRDAIGARVRILYGDAPHQRAQTQEITAGSSFLSMDSKWLTFGLGDVPATTTIEVQVDWPDGPQVPMDPANWISYGPFLPNGTERIYQD